MYAVWFTFEENDELILQDIINKLSKEFNSTSFKPHITAYGLVDTKLDEISNICQEISSKTKPFDVHFLDISYSEYFWKTLFVNLNQNRIMIEIFENFCKIIIKNVKCY
mgnify:CR=1 FL=1